MNNQIYLDVVDTIVKGSLASGQSSISFPTPFSHGEMVYVGIEIIDDIINLVDDGMGRLALTADTELSLLQKIIPSLPPWIAGG